MVSVAMCTYNGEIYLAEQLESISQQSHQVGELVVCDDGSTDKTIDVLTDFAKKASFPVRIYSNTKNLGSTKNFEKALTLCQGDILILCDQDDVWKPEKVSQQVAFLDQNPDMEAVFSNADLIDGKGGKLPEMLWDNFGFDQEKQNQWRSGGAKEILFEGYIVTGATLAVRKRALELLCPFPVGLGPYIHDAWMALVLSLDNKIGFIEDGLISYRLHESQQVGFGLKLPPVTLKDRWRRSRAEKMEPIITRADLLKRLFNELSTVKGVTPESLIKLKEAQEHFQARASLPANRLLRFKPAISELRSGRYAYSSEHWWLPFLGDLFE